MSDNSGIQWTTHTFNPWWGCTKVHDGCTHCYAESLDKRFGDTHWGNNPRRMVLGEWGKPAKWNATAERLNMRTRVFCASMCDLFEDYDGPVVDQRGDLVAVPEAGYWWTVDMLRARVFGIIRETPFLDWLLLTKRPENITRMVPPSWLKAWPANVLTGTSPCNQETADKCIPNLLYVPGRHFLSCEPLLGSVDLDLDGFFGGAFDEPCPRKSEQLHWVIVGCESRGKRAGRFADGYAEAAIAINRQCRVSRVPVFNKQVPINGRVSHDPSEWPEALRAREFYA